jgi:hypothetical protein
MKAGIDRVRRPRLISYGITLHVAETRREPATVERRLMLAAIQSQTAKSYAVGKVGCRGPQLSIPTTMVSRRG